MKNKSSFEDTLYLYIFIFLSLLLSGCSGYKANKYGESKDKDKTSYSSPKEDIIDSLSCMDGKLEVETVQTNNKFYVKISGKKGEEFDEIFRPATFDDECKKVAYIARLKDEWFVVLMEKKSKPYKEIVPPPLFSPDSKHLTFIAKKDTKYILVVDNKEVDEFNELGVFPQFSQNGDKIRYGVKEKDGSLQIKVFDLASLNIKSRKRD